MTAASNRPARVLVTGGAGYVGSSLVPLLLERGFSVRVLDSFLFGESSLESVRGNSRCELVRGDVRDVQAVARAMQTCDAVVHLAAVVGDSACDENRRLAAEVNRASTRTIAELARGFGVKRFVFASSCSVYGASDLVLDETSALNPLSLYARTKVDSEAALLASKTRDFAPTVLRLGTLFGLSPRMRFDLVVNLFVKRAASEGRITVFNAEQWRPFVHVHDAARAIVACLRAAPGKISGEIFNVGSSALNLQIRDVGEAIRRTIPGTEIERIENNADRRNYRVSFKKIQAALRFECGHMLEPGIAEMYAAIRSVATPALAGEFQRPAVKRSGALAKRRSQVAARLFASA